MLFYLKIGMRNLLKNNQRTVKTVLTIVIGLSACLLMQGFMSHTLWGLRESIINGGLGHVQIYRQGYLKQGDTDSCRYLITNTKTIIARLKRLPDLKLMAPELSFQGIITAGEKNTVFMGTAGLPQAETVLNHYAILEDGAFLRADKPFGVVIGSGVARKLGVRVGDTVTLMSTLKNGGVNALDMEISGIVETQVKAYNDVVLLANLNTVQNFMALPDSVDRIVLLLNQTKNLRRLEPYLQKACNIMGLEYSDWAKLAGKQYMQPKLFYDLVNLLMMVIIVFVVIFAIINTLNLSMQERIREIGTIRSLGTTRLQVGKIFIGESFLIGLIGGFCGIAVGYGLAAILNGLGGIPIPPPPGHVRGYIAFFKPDFIQALRLWFLFLITAVLAGLYPAVRAGRLPIVDAMRRI
jgi:putative ABC transport system permease protein